MSRVSATDAREILSVVALALRTAALWAVLVGGLSVLFAWLIGPPAFILGFFVGLVPAVWISQKWWVIDS